MASDEREVQTAWIGIRAFLSLPITRPSKLKLR